MANPERQTFCCKSYRRTCFMRVLFAIVFSIAVSALSAQDLAKRKAGIEKEVEQIDKLSVGRTQRFSIKALKKGLHSTNYHTVETSRGLIKISRQFSSKNDSVEQQFYLKNGKLIYAHEIITSYFTVNNQKDSIGWSGRFYFSQNKLIDYITLGHGKSEMETWNPEEDMLTAFNESKRDIARFKKRKGR